jgi:hypothetical protein
VSTPVRYVSRYGSAARGAPHGCRACGAPLRSARAAYCSPGCTQRAYRLRQVAPPADDATARPTDLKRRQRLVAQTIYECPTCGERYLGERRCPDCNRFCRALGGTCPHCEEPILVAELLGGEGVL